MAWKDVPDLSDKAKIKAFIDKLQRKQILQAEILVSVSLDTSMVEVFAIVCENLDFFDLGSNMIFLEARIIYMSPLSVCGFH